MPKSQTEVERLHRKAMDLAGEAIVQEARTVAMRRHALSLETEAAMAVPMDMEPTRSVMFRSAASLALQVHELRKAAKLVAEGLAGSPPDDVRSELLSILNQIEAENA